MVSRQLQAFGYSCSKASSANAAQDLLPIHHYDLVMLDVRMRGMSGLELLKKARAKYPNICFVMLSALNDVPTVAEAIKLGADDYIVKPCAMDYLRVRLESALERRQEAGPDHLTGEVNVQAIADDLASQRAALFGNG